MVPRAQDRCFLSVCYPYPMDQMKLVISPKPLNARVAAVGDAEFIAVSSRHSCAYCPPKGYKSEAGARVSRASAP
jgi:hypothetical protein